MLNDAVGEMLLAMDRENGEPIFDPGSSSELPLIIEGILTPDQRKGYIQYSDEALELAALGEMVLKYRYPDGGVCAFLEELIWRLTHCEDGTTPPDVPVQKILREWFEEELDNSAQLKFGFT